MTRNNIFINLIVFLIISITLFVFYSNALRSPFIWDDDGLVVKNTLIQSLGNLPKAFVSDLYPGVASGSNFYRPIQTISYMLDYFFWQLDPFGYHLTNIFLQILASFLVFLMARMLLADTKIAISTALLFALNPLSNESVVYISGRAEMLMSVFLISSFLLFIRERLYISIIMFILALLSKELAVIFPLAIISYLIYFKKDIIRNKIELVKRILPFFLIVIVYLALRLTVFHFATLRPPALTKYPLLLRITMFPKVIFTYLKLYLFPVDLHMSWTLARPTTHIGIFFSWFILGIICVLCVRMLKDAKNNKITPFLLSWLLIFLIPQSGIVPINAFVAEHFVYLSSISVFILISAILRKCLRRKLFFLVVAIFVCYYGLLTFTRNYDWKDELLFYSKILKYSPDSFQAHNNIGLQYEYRHDLSRAISEYKEALRIEPSLIEARSNLANVYFKIGKYKEAKDEYAIVEKSISGSKAGELQNNIGCIYEVEGKLDEAFSRYKKALELDPTLNFSHFNIAKIYFIKGKTAEAAQEVLSSLPEISLDNDRINQYLILINNYMKSVKNLR
jgi:lipoprotein NlpI